MRSGKYGWQTIEPTPAHEFEWPGIRRLLPPGKLVVLDMGCGNGFLAAQLAALGHSVTGIDESPDGIALARAAHPGIRFEVRSAYDDLGDLTTGADLVVCSDVVEHLFDPHLALERAFCALRPGGALILTTPYHGYLKNLALSVLDRWDSHHTVHWVGGHIKFFSKKTLSTMLLSCGYGSIRFRNVGRITGLWKSMVCIATKPAHSRTDLEQG